MVPLLTECPSGREYPLAIPKVEVSLSIRRNSPDRNNTLHLIGPHGSLTTEYKPLERDTSKKLTVEPSSITAPAPPAIPTQSLAISDPKSQAPEEPQVDPSTLPIVTAPSTAPKIELNKDGTMDGRSIYEVDIASLENKGWRRPGSDLSDWFNYGFDEISWEAYAVRRRDLGEMAPILKANVLVCHFDSPKEAMFLLCGHSRHSQVCQRSRC
jgi:pre-mRNA 3'-end-processing factor FIP1